MLCNCFPNKIRFYNPCPDICEFIKYLIVNDIDDRTIDYKPLKEIIITQPKKNVSCQTNFENNIVDTWEHVVIN